MTRRSVAFAILCLGVSVLVAAEPMDPKIAVAEGDEAPEVTCT